MCSSLLFVLRCSDAGAGCADAAARSRLDLQQLAADVVDLQRRVVEAEALVQHRLHRAPRRVAVAVGADEHVRGERREAARDLPDVQVVNLDDVRLGDERRADRLRVETLGRGLQEDPPGGAHERDARADHQRGDQQRDDRVGALEAGREDHAGGDRRADEAVEVGQQVLEAALDVEALAVRAARASRSRRRLTSDAGERDGEHQPAAHVAAGGTGGGSPRRR